MSLPVLRPIDAVLGLRAVPELAPLPLNLLGVLAREATEVEVPAGTRVRDEGEENDTLFVVTHGSIQLRGPAGVTEVGPGGTAGLMHLLADERPGLTVTAEHGATLLSLDGDGIRLAAEEHLGILLRLAEVAATSIIDDPARAAGLARGWPDTPSTPPSMDRVRRILALHRTRLLPSTSMDALAELSSFSVERSVERGEPLNPPESGAKGIWVVAAGEVSLTSGAGNGAALPLGPGSVVGMPELILDRPGRALAVGEEPGVALWFEREVILDVMEDHFELGWRIVAALASAVLGNEPTPHDGRS